LRNSPRGTDGAITSGAGATLCCSGNRPIRPVMATRSRWFSRRSDICSGRAVAYAGRLPSTLDILFRESNNGGLRSTGISHMSQKARFENFRNAHCWKEASGPVERPRLKPTRRPTGVVCSAPIPLRAPYGLDRRPLRVHTAIRLGRWSRRPVTLRSVEIATFISSRVTFLRTTTEPKQASP
jgi:hypothetical protein